MNRNVNFGLLILRLSLGILMLLHGIAKLKGGVSGIEGMLVARGIPGFLAYGVYIGEVLAPVLLIAGYRTRLAALLLMLNCLVAAFLAHSGQMFALGKHGGWAVELLGLYFFGALVLLFTGGGRYALSVRQRWD